MDVTTQKRNAKNFIEEWKDRGREKQDSQSFWLSLLRDVLGIENPETFIKFEEKVKLSHDSFIDGYIDQTHVMIEQKGSDKDLDKAIRQSDGSLLTPFQQAQRYSAALPYSRRPRWIVTCNFKEFRVYDMEHPNNEPQIIKVKNLSKEYYRLDFLVDKSNQHLEKEMKVSMKAGELVGKLYDELLKQYKDSSSEHTQKSINQLCVRLVFCLYAEDAGLFGRHDMFYDYLSDKPVNEIRRALIDLFRVLDTKLDDRDTYLVDDDPKLAEFPYVNGGMFADKNIEVPPFNEKLRNLLLNQASLDFDWSDISPTIFGAVFESTLNPETRRKGGMHYTSVENIHKVIDPLFLNDLKDELNQIKQYKQPAVYKQKAKDFQLKLSQLKFMDPACGSGNFLTETYLQIRKLENEAIKLIYDDKPALDVGQNIIQVSIQQFYGIEINDFAVSVAKTALWIAESQMYEETKSIIYSNDSFLPLKTYTHIVEGNALRLDWNTVVPNYETTYIMGNPPFIGYFLQTKAQKEDMHNVFVDEKGKSQKYSGKMDYVTAWYRKAAEYIENTKIEVSFVSTNSITQGEQVQFLWKNLFARFHIKINFAYTTFKWTNDASKNAQVYVVIIGFSQKERKNKILFGNGTLKLVKHINAYLIDADDIFIKSRVKPIESVPPMIYGSKPVEHNNLILTPTEYQDLIKNEPLADQYVKPFMGGKELLNGNLRYCLWLINIKPNELKSMPLVLKRVQAVREFRLSSKKKATQKSADTPTLFQEIRQPDNDYIAVPEVSTSARRYIPMGFVKSNVIASNLLLMIPNASIYEFGILESNMHMAWMRTVAGRLGNGYRYSAKIVYNNFPWPVLNSEQKKKICKTAQGILDARDKYPESSLVDLYDELTMPSELRKAHQANDKAVMAAYGLPVKGTTESDAVAHLFKMYEDLTK